MTTPYDRVAYPTAVFAQTHPERLAVLGRLAGLDPPDPARSRILEIGGGDCLNLISIAAAWPECDAHGFDLSEQAIAKGQEFLDASGIPNVTLAVDDILTAHDRYPAGSFDYVIVHGVYAWVPPKVRAATMALVAHVLSDRGIAFISYNCMPGGRIRQIMREMLMLEIGGIGDPDLKLDAARSFLEDYARDRSDDEPIQLALREMARNMLERPDNVLFHDELGECFNPQRLDEVVTAAAGRGLRYLTDAGRRLHLDGFLPEGAEPGGDPDTQVLYAALKDDYASLRFFRQSTFVRASRPIDRRLDAARIEGLYFTTNLERRDDGSFTHRKDQIELRDTDLADALEAAAKLSPQRVPVSEVARTPEQLSALVKLHADWYIALHLAPAPFVDKPSDTPETSPLVRGMIAQGQQMVATLNHSLLRIDQRDLRALLSAADGSRSMAELAALDHGIPAEQVPDALKAAAQFALLRR